MENINNILTDSRLNYEIISNKKFLDVVCNNGKNLKLLVQDEICHIKSEYQEIVLLNTYEFGRCLFLNGIIQSCEMYHHIYDNEILKHLNSHTKKLLILGGGDGNVLKKALEINPIMQVTLIEIDNEVINVCDKYIYNSLFKSKNVIIKIDNAFSFLKNPYLDSFDQIVIDLSDYPIGLNFSEITDYYIKIINLSLVIVPCNSYLSAYIGCDRNIANSVIKLIDFKTELVVLDIPSFGELCYILHIFKN